MNLLRSLLGKPGKPPHARPDGPEFKSPIAPEKDFFAIGDIHGCLKRFGDLLLQIEKIETEPTVVLVGDMVDRGEQSAGVLNLARRLNTTFPEHFVCLSGNHEAMLLQFLASPEAAGDRWLRNGGLQTVASYKLSHSSGQSLVELRDRLYDAMGQDMVDWLIDLPLSWQTGNVAVVHAGADPDIPMPGQSESVLLWGHSDFTRRPRADGVWIVHGHTIVREPQARNGRISIDTGAYATGRLTAAHIRQGSVDYLTA